MSQLQELLASGCKKQNFDSVEQALAQGAVPDQVGADGSSPAGIAVESWRRQPTPILKEILLCLGKAGARAKEIDHLLLFDAIKPGDAEVVREILARGVEADDLTEALRISAIFGHLEIVRQLLDAGADLHGDDSAALLGACQSGQLEVVRELIQRGASLEATEPSIGSTLDQGLLGRDTKAVTDRPYDELIAYLRSLGVTATGLYKNSPEARAVETPAVSAGEAVEYSGGDVNESAIETPPLGETDRRLFEVVIEGGVDLLGEVLKAGANPNARMDVFYEEELDYEDYSPGKTALMEACSLDAPEVLRILLAAGAEIELRDSSGFTALHWAVQAEAPATVQALIEEGAVLEARDIEDSTPLHWAAGIGSIDLVRPLVAAGADVEARDYKGETPLSVARLSEAEEVVAFLEATSGS